MIKLIEIRSLDGENRLFIDNQLFDWGIDEEAIEQIKKIENEEDLQKINENIKDFFLECLSSIVGKKMNIKEAYEAIISGQVDV
jgi:transcription termination factor NusB